jgi:hypothetical protein
MRPSRWTHHFTRGHLTPHLVDSGQRMPFFNSSAVKRAEYDPTTKRLEIWFPEGHSYIYCGVTEQVYQGLLHTPSKGTYFNARIRDFYRC